MMFDGVLDQPPSTAMTPSLDEELRATVQALAGRVLQPVGRSIHVHQLDGVRTEAMIYLDEAGTRIEWAHGKGDCAITGEGAAILAVLQGGSDPEELEADHRLVLYGDRDRIRLLPQLRR